jgi:xylulokinase
MGHDARELIVAADIGTTAIKVAVLDRAMAVVASVAVPHPIQFPKSLWAEQNPEDWWTALASGLRELGKAVPDLAKRVAALGFAAQMCGVVAVDQAGTPLRPCLIWLDKRAGSLVRAKMGGFPSIAGFGAFKLLRSIQLTNGAPSLVGADPPGKMMWLRQHEPEVWARTAKLLDVKDWILHRCTGAFVTTADSANLTWMADTRRGKVVWSDELMGKYGVPRHMLPDIAPGDAVVAGLSQRAAADLGLPEGLPVIAGCGDVCAAALGSGATEDGALHICLGTSAWIAGFFDSRRVNALAAFATITSPVANKPLLIATQECAGACLDWFARVSDAGDQQSTGSGTAPPLFLPWLAGERVPVDDNRLAGAFLGLKLSHDRGDLARAVTEGVALNLRWAMTSVRKQRGVRHGVVVPILGGATLNDGLSQAMADCLQIDLRRPPDPQMAGLRGVAALAGASLGWYPSALSAVSDTMNESGTLFRANPASAPYFGRRFDLFKDAYKRLAPWYHVLEREV